MKDMVKLSVWVITACGVWNLAPVVFGGPAGKPEPSQQHVVPKAGSPANAPMWARIVLDEQFSARGKVWALQEELYGILKANGRAPGKLDRIFCMGSALRDTGLPIEAFLKKYGPGTLNQELQRGTDYHVYGQIALGSKPGEDHFTSLCAYERLFDRGFVSSAHKVGEDSPVSASAAATAISRGTAASAANPGEPSPQDGGKVSITAMPQSVKVLSVKAYNADEFSRQGYWYEDGSPMGMPRPTFSPSLPNSAFVAVRVNIAVETDPIRIDQLHLLAKPKGEFTPIASKPCSSGDTTDDFVFAYDPGKPQWNSVRRWTTIVFPWNELSYRGDKLLWLNATKNSSICVNLVYETPRDAKALTMETSVSARTATEPQR